MGWFRLIPQEKQYWRRFKAGLRVDIFPAGNEREGYHTEIKEVSGDSLYLKAFLFDNSAFLEIKPGVFVMVKVYSEDGVFKFKSRIISWDWKKGFIQISKPAKIEHFQYRQYYRLNRNLPLEYGIVSLVSDLVLNFQGVTKDISIGGMAMVGTKKISLNTIIKACIHLQEDNSVTILAKVLAQEKLNIEDKFISRLQFTDINSEDAKKIEAFIFAQLQRKGIT